MQEIFIYLSEVVDPRQQHKIEHTLSDIIMIVFFAQLANCNHWSEVYLFATRYESSLQLILPLENGIPSKDTMSRVIGMINPSVLEEVKTMWYSLLSEENRQEDGKFLAVDGKTMRGNHQNDELPLHIVTAYNVQEGLSFGQIAVEEKSNEITAIPKLLKSLQIKGQTITIDAMGTQTEIAKQICKQKADYVLAVKGNQKMLYEEVKTYLDDSTFEKELKSHPECYLKTIESARSQIETREYYQTGDIGWMEEKSRWIGLKSIGKAVTTIEKNGKTLQDTRYYISSHSVEIDHFKMAVRGHWSIESMHWHLDVTFNEDGNHTLNKNAAQNLNIIRKMAIPFLKEMPLGKEHKYLSMKSRRFMISLNFPFYLGMIYEMFFVH